MSTPLLHRRRLMMQSVGGGGDYPLPQGWIEVLYVYFNSFTEIITTKQGELTHFRIKGNKGAFTGDYSALCYGEITIQLYSRIQTGVHKIDFSIGGVLWQSIPLNFDPKLEDFVYDIEYTNNCIYLNGNLELSDLQNPLLSEGGKIYFFGEKIGNNTYNEEHSYYIFEYDTTGEHVKILPCKRPYAPSYVGAMFDCKNNRVIADDNIRIRYVDL